jgi:hypothetical protein
MGELVGAFVELAVREMETIKGEGGRIRGAKRLFKKEVMNAGVAREGRGRAVPLDEQLLTLAVG